MSDSTSTPVPGPGPPAAAPPARPFVPVKFNADVRDAYLTHLAETGERYGACHAAGMSYVQVTQYYRPSGDHYDETFAEAREAALAAFAEMLAREVRRRAVEGWIERELQDKDGNVVGHVTKFSDRLLELALKRADPAYREHVKVDSTLEASVKPAVAPIPVELSRLNREGRDALRLVMAQMGDDEAPRLVGEGRGEEEGAVVEEEEAPLRGSDSPMGHPEGSLSTPPLEGEESEEDEEL